MNLCSQHRCRFRRSFRNDNERANEDNSSLMPACRACREHYPFRLCVCVCLQDMWSLCVRINWERNTTTAKRWKLMWLHVNVVRIIINLKGICFGEFDVWRDAMCSSQSTSAQFRNIVLGGIVYACRWYQRVIANENYSANLSLLCGSPE